MRDSHWVGLTLPGMMDDPGSFSGMASSPYPDLGPEERNLTSLAIFMVTEARVLRVPLSSTMGENWDKATRRSSADLKLELKDKRSSSKKDKKRY